MLFKANYKTFILIFVLGAAAVSAAVLLSSVSCQYCQHFEEIVPQDQTGLVAKKLGQQKTQEPPITLLAVGDIMLDRGVNWYAEQNNDWRFPFLKIAEDLRETDLVFGNLEGPISDKGERVGSIYSFRADPGMIEGLIYGGFDVLSLANNHALDYGREALKDTMERLKEAGIDYVGAGVNKKEAFSLKIKEIKNTRIGFLAYTNLGPEVWRAGENYSGIAWVSEDDIEEIKADIEEAKEEVDVLIVSFHAGEEYSSEPTLSQVSFSRGVVEAGADVVVGHHPHVVQKLEKYQNGWIAYSLGNFVFDQGFSEETMRGLLLKILIEDKKIKEVIPIEVQLNKSFQPEILQK